MGSSAKISKAIILSMFIIFIIIASVKIVPEKTEETPPPPPFERDYANIAESKTLIVALTENATEYCIFKAIPRGFQMETFEDFAAEHGLELEIIPTETEIEAENLLNQGKCDIIVCHTPQLDTSCMSHPLLTSSDVILTNTKDLADSIYITELQSKSLGNLNTNIICANVSTDKLARKVATKEIKAAICDSALALTYQKAYPRLEIDTTICIRQNIVWKTNPRAVVLRDSINAWLLHEKETKEFKLRQEIYYSYININVSNKYYSGMGNQISAYDDIIRKHSNWLKWDWRYIASIIYEESHFNPDIGNPSGAYGLMQLMPLTYSKFASDSTAIYNPDGQVKAGVHYIAYLRDNAPKAITDSAVLARYILMAYNAGHGRAEDAFRLAEKHSDNPNSWENLSEYMELLIDKNYHSDPVVKCGKYRGSRTVSFTNNVINRYKHYRNLIKE